MFTKGSRYRNLTESTPVTAKPERPQSKELRRIPETEGQFEHTVRDDDRLDLLALKYYGDSVRWWQINDANVAQHSFPTDILDERPIVKERLVLRHPDFRTRFEELRISLHSFGEVRSGRPDFIESTVTVVHDGLPATRQAILSRIKDRKFEFRRAFAWSIGSSTAEAFTFDDPEVKSNWRILVTDLTKTPGMMNVRSTITKATLDVVYDSAMVPGEAILTKVEGHGFMVDESSTFSRVGKKLIVPPNQIG